MNATDKRAFMQRWKAMKGALDTHPYAAWVAMIDASTGPACAALHGKAWRVDGPLLRQVAETHLGSRIKECRCRLRPMSMRALLAEGVPTQD